MEEVSLGQTIVSITTNHKSLGFIWFIWWYAFGYAAPWLFPATFNGGDPNLVCSSADFFSLFNDYDLTLNVQSFTEKSPGHIKNKIRKHRIRIFSFHQANFTQVSKLQFSFCSCSTYRMFFSQISLTYY